MIVEVELLGRTIVKNDSQSNSQGEKRKMRMALQHEIEQSHITTKLDNYQFIRQASPEMDLANVDISIPLFAKTLRAPFGHLLTDWKHCLCKVAQSKSGRSSPIVGAAVIKRHE